MKKILFPLALIFSVVTMVYADEAYDIVKKSTSHDVPDTSHTTLILHNVEKSGSTTDITIKQHGRTEQKDGSEIIATVFDVRSPAKDKDTRILQQARVNGADDRWIYMKSLKQVRRITMTDRTKSFVGSEFTYNDMALRDVDADKHELLSSNESVTLPNGKTYKNCYKIKSVPNKKSEVEYAHRIQYIDKDTYFPMKIEFFDKKDPTKIMKTYTTDNLVHFKAPSSGKTYYMRMGARMVNNITGRQTVVEVKDPIFDEQISASYFTQQFLSTGKAK